MTYDDWEEWVYDTETVESESITDQGRWETYWTKVVKKDGKFYRLDWASGSTEYQDRPFEDTFHQVTEVEPKQVTVTKYVNKETN